MPPTTTSDHTDKIPSVIPRCTTINPIDTDYLLQTPLLELAAHANKIRNDALGSAFEACNIINAKSGLCPEDCKFCAQSARHSCSTETYPLKTKEEIFAAAQQAQQMNAQNFGIVTSGNRPNAQELDTIAQAIAQITRELAIPVCASLGSLKKEQLAALQDAGLTRYHHNIETSPRFYPHIVSSRNFDDRIATIKAAKSLGLEVCSGGIIGMGETWQDRIDMAMLLKDLNVDSVPINILVPIEGTQLQSLKPLPCTDAIRTLCIFRIILPEKTIKIAAGRETILKDFQALGFMAGANGMLIGGYLTTKGREVSQDQQLIEEIQTLWAQ